MGQPTQTKQPPSDGMTAEGLVQIPEQPERNLGTRLVAIIVLVCTAIVLLGTAYLDYRYPLATPKLRGGEKVRYEQMKQNATWVDGSLARYIEHDYRLRSKVRNYLAEPYAGFLMRKLHETNSKVLLGNEGWMYYTDRVVLPPGPIDRGVVRAAAEQAALSRRFAALGMRLVAIPLIRKSVIAAEFLPRGYKGYREVDEAIITEFRKRGVETIDLFAEWEKPGPEPVYQRRDTHWSTEGLRRTALATADQIGRLAAESNRLGAIQVGPEQGPPGALYRINNTRALPSEMHFAEKAVQWISNGEEKLEPGTPAARYALCGTSFSEKGVFATFLSHYLGEPVYSIGLPGKPPQASLLHLLRMRARKTFPEIVFEEIPNYRLINHSNHASSWYLGKDPVDIFMEFPAKKVIPLEVPTELLDPGATLHTKTSTQKNYRIIRIAPGWIGHSGGGVVELAIDLKLLSEQATLKLNHQIFRLQAPCKQGWGRYFLPLITPTPSAEETALYVSPVNGSKEIEFEVKSVALVSALDIGTAISAEVLPAKFKQTACTQELRLPSGTTLTPHGTLIIESELGEGTWRDVQATVENSRGDQQQQFHFPLLRRGAWILVVPGSLTGQELGKITVTGNYNGKGRTDSWLTRARLLQVRATE